MRAIYQSKIGIGLMDIGVKELLQSISEKEGASLNCSSSTCTNLRGRLKSVTSLIRVVMQLNIGMISCLLNTLSFCSFTSAVVEVMFNNSSFFSFLICLAT